jgi:hypothetical protein
MHSFTVFFGEMFESVSRKASPLTHHRMDQRKKHKRDRYTSVGCIEGPSRVRNTIHEEVNDNVHESIVNKVDRVPQQLSSPPKEHTSGGRRNMNPTLVNEKYQKDCCQEVVDCTVNTHDLVDQLGGNKHTEGGTQVMCYPSDGFVDGSFQHLLGVCRREESMPPFLQTVATKLLEKCAVALDAKVRVEDSLYSAIYVFMITEMVRPCSRDMYYD